MIGRSKEVDRDPSTVPTGSRNCVLGRYSTTRWSNYNGNKSPTTVLERRNMGTGLFYLFALEKLTIEKEFFFSLPHFLGDQIVFCLRGPTCHRASWQPRQSATEY
ncbi:hypothetical protein AVEN_216912-1 [Araneus ventricosus]|uniref:Uncharacterized protein n=1 Tax=Araneus ventricosus TaxID=182803 RepID=A0A4Y2T990_ARAVE|nr:hypothetical protein AVEN_216912-1 [Araneus ventricosus]